MDTKFKFIIAGLIGILVFIQFIPADRSNPPVSADLSATPEVKEILKNSCYDCHSNETVWPWYSHVAPVSWLITGDVKDGRRHLNFSEWENLSKSDKAKTLSEIREEVEEGEMPLPIYTFMHSDADLTEDQISIIAEWTKTIPDSTNQK
jgi:hypothetical protein